MTGGRSNRAAYTNGKAAFVKAVLRKARRKWPVRTFTARYRPEWKVRP